MTKKAAYFTLLGATHDAIPDNYAGKVIVQHEGVNLTTLQNVRNGKTHDLELLVLIVKCTMPDYEIPEEINTFLNPVYEKN